MNRRQAGMFFGSFPVTFIAGYAFVGSIFSSFAINDRDLPGFPLFILFNFALLILALISFKKSQIGGIGIQISSVLVIGSIFLTPSIRVDKVSLAESVALYGFLLFLGRFIRNSEEQMHA